MAEYNCGCMVTALGTMLCAAHNIGDSADDGGNETIGLPVDVSLPYVDALEEVAEACFAETIGKHSEALRSEWMAGYVTACQVLYGQFMEKVDQLKKDPHV